MARRLSKHLTARRVAVPATALAVTAGVTAAAMRGRGRRRRILPRR